MRLLFFLSGELPGIAEEEVRGLFSSYGKLEVLDRDDQILIIKFVGNPPFKRLAMTHEVCKHFASCEFDELESVFEELPLPSGRTCVRVRKIGKRWEGLNSLELERRLGAVLWRRGTKISVSSPDVVVRVYLAERAHIGFLIHVTDRKQFLERSPNKRPFFMPSVIVPRLARALVNITGVREGGRLLDPMCGTGTFLIEVGLMGIEFVGLDVFRKVIYGCARNLAYFGLPKNIVRGDARALPFEDNTFDAVVTDFPYQRSTRKFGENLYELASDEIFRVLKPHSRAVLVINFDADDLFGRNFILEAKYYQRVHKSLVRRFYVCRCSKAKMS